MVKDKVLTNNWHAVVLAQDLPPGKIFTVRVLGEDIVVWRTNSNQVSAGEDRCPHRGTSFARGWVKDDNILCPYHGFAFNTSGQCVYTPFQPEAAPSKLSRACFKTYQVQERYGLIWVCLGTPEKSLPNIPEWEDSQYRRFKCNGPFYYQSSALRAMENFFDYNHSPYVHWGTLSSPEHAHDTDDYKIQVDTDGIKASVNLWQVDFETKEPTKVQGDYTFFDPLTICFRTKDSKNNNMASFFTVTPIEEDKCVAWMWMLMDHAHHVPEDVFMEMGKKIVEEDVGVVDSQRPRRLPLDLEAEFHMEKDRSSVTYRKWLKQLGVTFGALY